MMFFITVGGLAKVAIFSTNLLTKHAFQIYEKLSYEARNRHFCQTAVMCWAFVHCIVKRAVNIAVNGSLVFILLSE